MEGGSRIFLPTGSLPASLNFSRPSAPSLRKAQELQSLGLRR